MPDLLPRGGEARSAHDDGQIVDGPRKVLIHNNIIELPAVPQLVARRLEAGGNHLGRILSALDEALRSASIEGGTMKM